MDLFVDPTRPRQVSRSLYDQIRHAIACGRLQPGDRLPTSRDLAAQLGVARQTITTVYARLSAEGHTIGRGTAGTYVAAHDTAPLPRSTRRVRGATPSATAPVDEPVDEPGGDIRFDLRSGTPDLSLFPVKAWQRAVHAVTHQAPAGYGQPAGLDDLRRALARQAARTRSVVADADQIVVTAGAQAAIDLALRLLTRPGDTVAIEEPGYPPVRDLVVALGRRVAPVPVDADGIRPELIPAHARVVYTTPSHQSPTGATLSLPRRRLLLARAERHDQTIVEDDYDSEHRHVDRPLEPLHLLDTSGRVVYVATFSKTLAPGLRLGYAIFPPHLAPGAVQLRSVTDVQPPDLLQRAMHRFLVDGELDRHLRRVRRTYGERHALVTAFLDDMVERDLLVPLATNNAGLHVAVRLTRTTEDALTRRLATHGVRLGGYRACWHGSPDHDGAVIGFGNIATADLAAALHHVRDALTGPRRGR